MKKSRYSMTGSFLVLALTLSLIPASVSADGGSDDEVRPLRLYATAFTGPVGAIDSYGPIFINGRRVDGKRLLWGGELLQSPPGKRAHISFDSVGRVTLGSDAMVRFAVSREGSSDGGRRALVASVITGDMTVELQADAGAYIRACGEVFIADRGSNFHLGVSEGRTELDTVSGRVSVEEQAAQRQYVVRPVGIGANISVRARTTRQIQVQVIDENDRPVPDLPIIFSLAGGAQGFGSFGGGAAAANTVTVTTNAQGIATTSFTAGNATGSASITARVEGTRFSWTGTISVTKAAGFWTARNTLLVAGAAAAGATIGIVAATNDDERQPIVAVPPPVVRP